MIKVVRWMLLAWSLLFPYSAFAAIDFSESSLLWQAPGLHRGVLQAGLKAYNYAVKQGMTHSPFLTLVDYSAPSVTKRLWVIDLRSRRVLFSSWVAHGERSGDQYAKKF